MVRTALRVARGAVSVVRFPGTSSSSSRTTCASAATGSGDWEVSTQHLVALAQAVHHIGAENS